MQRKIYPCEEFSPIEVPLTELIVNGEISIYPETEKFFDLDWRAGRLVVAPKSFIGLIPINKNIAIKVLPRFPISNLFWIVHRAGSALRFIEGHLRKYAVEEDHGLDPLHLIAKRLTELCTESLRSGILRKYLYSTSTGAFGNSLQLSPTVSLYRSAGIRHISIWQDVVLSEKLKENRLLKTAITRVLAYFSSATDRAARVYSKSIEEILFLLDGVPLLSQHDYISEHEVIAMVERLPNAHKSYGAILWLSYLIHAKRGISVESVGSAEFHTFVINMADVFEDYVRAIIQDRIDEIIPGCKVKNGNVDQVRLFKQGDANPVKPDIYVLKNKTPILVLDAKYKPSVKPADRYEVLAFCEALEVNRAFFLLPGDNLSTSRTIGVTPKGTHLHLQRINLAASNMKEAEDSFIESIKNIVNPIT